MHVHRRRWWAILAALVLLSAVTGCMPGGVTDPGWTVVAATDDLVYAVLPTGLVVALEPESGDLVWQYPPPQERSGLGGLFGGGAADGPVPVGAVYGVPTLVDGLLVMGSYSGKLYAFEIDSGLRRWEIQISDDAIIGGATAYEGTLYFGSADYTVMAVDLVSGEPVWPAPVETQNRVWGRPAVDERYVYVGSMDHHTYAIDRHTGAIVWQTNVGGAVPGDVTLADGLVVVGSLDRQIHALDAETGVARWTAPASAWVWGEALVTDGTIYMGDLEGQLHAVSVADGTSVWSQEVHLEGAIRAGPALFDGALIVGTESGTLYRVDRDSGRFSILHEGEGAILSTPAVVGDRIYVGIATGQVIGIEMTERGPWQLWIYPPPRD